MPELPDVEQFKTYFKHTSLNQEIVGIDCSSKQQIKDITFERFKNKLIGTEFKGVERRGKFLIIEVGGISQKLIVHFAMTGEFHYVKPPNTSQKDRFARLVFKFKNQSELRWLNARKLGKIYLLKDPKQIDLIKEMGPEPLQISKSNFLELLSQHENKNIKAFLLDQRDIAGIGNVYSDEIMFQAKIDPHVKIKKLDKQKREVLYKKMRQVLKRAVEVNTSSQQFPNSWLIPYRERGDKCPQNKAHTLKREVIAGRGAIFCPQCQK